MKKVVFTIVLFILLFISHYSLVIAQSGWFWQNPLPQGNDLLSISFINQNTGYAVGNFGTVIKTTDMGETWKNVELPTTCNYTKIKFIDLNTGFLIRSDSTLLKTTNGGINWNIICNSIGKIYNFSFNSPDTGIIISGNDRHILKTTNGGINWFNFLSINNVYFDNLLLLNNNSIFCVGEILVQIGQYTYIFEGIYYTSTNGGLTWYNKIFSDFNYLSGLYFFNSTTGFIAGSGNYISKTTTKIIMFKKNYNQTFIYNKMIFCILPDIFYT